MSEYTVPIFIALLVLVLAVLTYPASSHSWYDAECCNTHDCQPVEPHIVTPTDEGWLVKVKPGEHRFVQSEQEYLVPYNHNKVRQSKDDQFHVCISAYINPHNGFQSLYCIYVPEMGV